MSADAEDPGWVGCRECGSLKFETLTTYPCMEGTLRAHRCSICGNRFASLATLYATVGQAHAVSKLTPLGFLPVRVPP